MMLQLGGVPSELVAMPPLAAPVVPSCVTASVGLPGVCWGSAVSGSACVGWGWVCVLNGVGTFG